MPLKYRPNDSEAQVQKRYKASLERAAFRDRETFKPQVFEDKYSDKRVAAWFSKLKQYHPNADLHAVVDGITGTQKHTLSKQENSRLLLEMFELYKRAKACAPLERYLRKFYARWNHDNIGRIVLKKKVRKDGTYDHDGLADMYRIAVIITAIHKYYRYIGRGFNPFAELWWKGGPDFSSFGAFKCEALMKRFNSINWEANPDLKAETVLELRKLEPFEGPKNFATLDETCGRRSRKRPPS
jgi:hypothetical protein